MNALNIYRDKMKTILDSMLFYLNHSSFLKIFLEIFQSFGQVNKSVDGISRDTKLSI